MAAAWAALHPPPCSRPKEITRTAHYTLKHKASGGLILVGFVTQIKQHPLKLGVRAPHTSHRHGRHVPGRKGGGHGGGGSGNHRVSGIVNAGDTLFSILKFSMKMSQYPNDSQVSSGPWPRLDFSLINDELEALSSVDRTFSDHEYTGRAAAHRRPHALHGSCSWRPCARTPEWNGQLFGSALVSPTDV